MQIQLIYDRESKSKQELKEIKLMINDALLNSHEYQRKLEEIKTLNQEKKEIADKIKADFTSELSHADTLKLDIDNDKMLMVDEALNQLMKGETVEVEDQYGNNYDPIFSVKFKRR